VASEERPRGQAILLKVPHHGSDNADDPAVWETMLADDPVAVVTPFNRGCRPLPSAADRERLRGRTPNVHQTAPTGGRRSRRPAVDEMVRVAGVTLREVAPRMGHVRFRARRGSPRSHTVEHFGAAARVV